MSSHTQVIPHIHRGGMLRRELLQIGFLGALGTGMTSVLGARPAAAAGKGPRAKGIILVWMPGGPPQMQFWDPKPAAPVECRGTGKPIKTSAPGVESGHRLPLTAQQAKHFALVRSVTLNAEDDNHILGDQKLLAGINPTPPNFNFLRNRGEW